MYYVRLIKQKEYLKNIINYLKFINELENDENAKINKIISIDDERINVHMTIYWTDDYHLKSNIVINLKDYFKWISIAERKDKINKIKEKIK